MKKKLLLLSFIEGSAVMTAELCGARLLSPIYGNSLFVWSGVMGITLGALASGYFFGARLSLNKDASYRRLFNVLNVAAISVIAMPAIAHYVVPRVSYLPFTPGVILSCFVLLFLPVFLLGATSPLFIDIQARNNEIPGKVSGTVYAISTAGGIFSTFFCGFFLIPEVGLNVSLLANGALLLITNLIIFRRIKAIQVMIFITLAWFSVVAIEDDKVILYSRPGLAGLLEVEDMVIKKDTLRMLKINGIVQTEMRLNSKKSVSVYANMLDSMIPGQRSGRANALVLGLGGGVIGNMLVEKGYQTTGVEFDERIIKAAQEFFFLNRKVKAVAADARYFLNHSSEKYDVIIMDLFKGEEQPSHVLTTESLRLLHQNLNDSSMLYINWHGYSETSRIGKGTAVLLNTIREAGYTVSILPTGKNEHHRNQVIVAKPTLVRNTNSGPVNTDDRQRLENDNASANKAWRDNYLRYYQQSGVVE